jgi:hypothetical protein
VAESEGEDAHDDDNVIRLRPGGTLRLVREPVPETPVDVVAKTLVDLRPVVTTEALTPTPTDEAVGIRDTADDFGGAVRAPVIENDDGDASDDDGDELPESRETRPSAFQVEGGGRRKRRRHRRLSITTSPGIISAGLMQHTPTPAERAQQSAPEPERPPSRPTQPEGTLSPVVVSQPPKPAGMQTVTMASFEMPTTIERPATASKTLIGISLTEIQTAAAAAAVGQAGPITKPQFSVRATPATEPRAVEPTQSAEPTPNAAPAARDDSETAQARITGDRGWQDSDSESSLRPIVPPKRSNFAPAMIALIAAAAFFAVYSMLHEPKHDTTKLSAPAQEQAAPNVAPTPVVEAPVAEAPVAEAPVAEAPVAEAPVAEAPIEPSVEQPVAEALPTDSATGYEDAMKRGRELDRKANTKAAIAAYEEALALNPNSSEALGKLAFHQLNRGKNAEAIELANRAVTADPTNSEGWIVLGAGRHALHDRDGAREAYRKCAELGTGTYVQECRHMLR